MQWLVVSLVLSLVLTVVVNVVLRLVPDAGERAARAMDWLTDPGRSDGRVRVFAPWKAMIVVSIVLTIVINVVLWLA